MTTPQAASASVALALLAAAPAAAQQALLTTSDTALAATPTLWIQADGTPPAAEPFTEGSWTFQSYLATTVGDDKGDQHDLHAGAGYFFRDGLSFNVEAFGGLVDPRDDDEGYVAGFDLLLRWHFLRDEQDARWSVYLATGAGFQEASTNFPSDSHHNFRLNVLDLGGTFRVTDTVNLMGGARYLHVSNAGTSDDNDGLDAAMLYAGVMIPF